MTTFFEVIAGDIRGVWADLRAKLLVNTCSEQLLAELEQLREDKADLTEKNKRLRAENTALQTLNLELRSVAFLLVKGGSKTVVRYYCDACGASLDDLAQ